MHLIEKMIDKQHCLQFKDATGKTVRIFIEKREIKKRETVFFYIIKLFDDLENLISYIAIPSELFFESERNILDAIRFHLIPFVKNDGKQMFTADTLGKIKRDEQGNFYLQFCYNEDRFIRACLLPNKESHRHSTIMISDLIIDGDTEMRTMCSMEITLEAFEKGKLQSAVTHLHYMEKRVRF